MMFRSIIAVGIVAAGLGTGAAPAMARTIHVMGMTIQQPETARQSEVLATGSVGGRYVVQNGRGAADRATRR